MGQHDDNGIIIGDKYKIDADSLNVTLFVKMVREDKTHYWYPKAYFCTAKNALDYMVDKEINGTGFADLQTICQKIEELYKLIQGLPDSILPKLKVE